MIVDSHQHFWNLERGANDWITDDIWQIKRDYTPDHLRDYLKHLGIDKTILVEASAEHGENDFMASKAAEAGFVGGIVGWVDLNAPDARARLDALHSRPIFKGVRPATSMDQADQPSLTDMFVQNATYLREIGLCMDAMALPHLIPFFTALAQAVPELPMLIDHCAKPCIGVGKEAGDKWRGDMAAFATLPNTYCKLSGITQEFGPGWTVAQLQPIFDHIFTHFGADRIMWGSDWPVLEMSASYTQWFDAMQQLISACSETEKAAILGNTAASFYKL